MPTPDPFSIESLRAQPPAAQTQPLLVELLSGLSREGVCLVCTADIPDGDTHHPRCPIGLLDGAEVVLEFQYDSDNRAWRTETTSAAYPGALANLLPGAVYDDCCTETGRVLIALDVSSLPLPGATSGTLREAVDAAYVDTLGARKLAREAAQARVEAARRQIVRDQQLQSLAYLHAELKPEAYARRYASLLARFPDVTADVPTDVPRPSV